MQLPSTSVLRSFEAAARFQSFTAAAELLGISQAVVSRQVREFEGLVGTALFRKEGRGVVLTAAGAALAQELHINLDSLRRTLTDARAAGAAGQSLRVALLPTFGSRWLAPRLTQFRDICPQARLLFESRTKPFDLNAAGVDLAIHFGGADWVGGRLTKLCPEDLVAVASPVLLDQCDVSAPQNSARLPLLHLSSRQTLWTDYFAELGLDARLAVAGDHFDQFSTIISAAVHRFGAAIVPAYLIEAELAQGTLKVFGTPQQGPQQYYIARPLGVKNELAAQFCDWIRSETQKSRQLRRHTP